MAQHHGRASPKLLPKQWGIGYDMVQKTIEVKTQLAMHHASHPLCRRHRTDLLSLNHKRMNEEFHTDTLFSKYESYSKSTCAQLFTTRSGFVVIYPMTSKPRCVEVWTFLIQDIGIPNKLFCNNAPEMVGLETNFCKATNYYRISLATNEPYTQKQNHTAEGTIGHMCQCWLDIQQQKQVSPRLWQLWGSDEPECFSDGNFIPEVDDVDRYDEYIGAELLFDFLCDDAARGHVIKHVKGEDGQPIGKQSINPILDSRMYTVQLSDGSHHKLSANIIAENLYAQVNEHRHHQLIFQEIIGHQTNAEYDNEMPIKTGLNFHLSKTMKGW
jgi:hypothetical protein